jgi:hypothetical protein
MSRRRHVTQATIVACALTAGAALGLLAPHGLTGSAGWSLAVGGVLWGFGATVSRAARFPLGLGERLLVGAVVWLFAAGVLLAAGLASRGPLMGIAAIGFALALRELVRYGRSPDAAAPSRRADLVTTVVLGGLLLAYLALNLLGAVTSRGNPFDDHVGYLAFVKRMLDRGDLIEPFSFRRISAYGGQTALHALAALRGDVESGDLLDRGIFQGIAVLLVIDLARKRQLHVGATAVIVVFLLFLSDLSINSASTWTGLAGFLGAYSLASDDDRPARASLVLTFLACAATCTLRQNYLLPAGLFAALLLVFHLRERARASSWRIAWAELRTTAALCIAAAAALLLPYAIAVWRSNATFLYPLLLGTANPAAPLRPSGATGFDELASLFTVSLDSEPIRVWWVLAPFMVLARDTRAGRPWPAFLIASVIGFGFMIHSFALSDTPTLWRYGWGYLTALAIVFVIEAAGKLPFVDRGDLPEPPLRLPGVAVCFVWLAVFTQLVQSRSTPEKRIAQLTEDIKAARELGTGKPADAQLYRDLQATISEHGRVAVLLDDAYLLDYRRNDIVNLDLPGFAAPGTGLPSFLGAARWRGYLAAQGIRYVAFVEGEHSTYLFRRRAWLPRIFTDTELFRFMGTHMIDALDTLGELARTSRVLFHRGGIYVIDLGDQSVPAGPDLDPPEPVRQDRYVRQLSETELHNAAWQLTSRSDVSFQIDGNGPSAVQLDLPDPIDPVADAVFGKLPAPAPHRWLSDRTHLRVYGHGRQQLHLKLRVDTTRLATVPTARLTLDGQELGRATAAPDGTIAFTSAVSCAGWCDVYLVFSTVAEYWAPAEALRAIKLLELDWTSVPR